MRNKTFFKQFSLPFNTVEWKNGADRAPEHLYAHSIHSPNPYVVDNETPLPSVAEGAAPYWKLK
ncbi:MAG: hypothetical protein IJV22_03205 [Bacteroidales bacterium]|nr:hypothetical protein [Bacteroidales bacterium]